MTSQGLIAVFAGPAGAGKNTILEHLVGMSNDVVRVVASTTRVPRQGEVDGIDYHFLSEADFDNLEKPLFDELTVNGFRYGTPLRIYRDLIASGRVGITHLALTSALALRATLRDVIVITVLPPSRPAQVDRLRLRGMSEDAISSRLEDDPFDLSRLFESDLILVNHNDLVSECANVAMKHVEHGRMKSH